METPVTNPKLVGRSLPLSSVTECQQIRAIIQTCACRQGMRREDSEDLAQNFLVYLVSYLQLHPQIDPCLTVSSAWLAHAAANWIRNGLRSQRRREHRESSGAFHSSEEGEETLFSEFISHEPSPEVAAIRAEFCLRVQSAILGSQLSPTQRILLEPLMIGESAADIGRRLGVSADTIRHRLRKMRSRLQASLRGCGLGVAEIQEYLSLLGSKGTRTP